ncbi:hypothetical protein [Microbacterium sp. 22242]|uniref:hypothetical protein n=1 Tax=Microbacterium sp. 22242 TaxID=3453896 RepID=UPI003F854E70
MRIAVHEVSKGKKGQALPPTSLEIETGHARFVLAETELRPTVLGLIATGRMRPDSGEVTIDGARNAKELRRRMALVDAPEVSDPHPGVTLAGVVGEELMFAGLPASPLHARRWLEQIGFAELAGRPIGTVKPSVRVRVMAELAVLRDDIEGFVLVSPDRHGGRPEGWWRIATEFADRGFAVLVIVGGSAAAVIERLPEALETDYPSNATVPVRPLADFTGSTAVMPVPAEDEPLTDVVDRETERGGDSIVEPADRETERGGGTAQDATAPDDTAPDDAAPAAEGDIAGPDHAGPDRTDPAHAGDPAPDDGPRAERSDGSPHRGADPDADPAAAPAPNPDPDPSAETEDTNGAER